MAVTQLSLPFSSPNSFSFIVRTRNFEEIKKIEMTIRKEDLIGEILLKGEYKITPSESITAINKTLDSLILTSYNLYYSKDFVSYEVFFRPCVDYIYNNNFKFAINNVIPVPNTNGAYILECNTIYND